MVCSCATSRPCVHGIPFGHPVETKKSRINEAHKLAKGLCKYGPNGISGSQDIIVTQRQIFKYRNHPKTTKGANLPVEDYGIIEATLKNPTNIFEDTVQKHLVYVYTHPYYGDRLAKVVVEPNYRSRGTVINLAKSWGIVEKSKMNGIQYRKIK